ncbi:hypothetical protein B5X24_HaOG210635 [Helicoverpa armigera]|nr:hypothetical protein B5X24_HaOG210635 [Helicoverpa armigera]
MAHGGPSSGPAGPFGTKNYNPRFIRQCLVERYEANQHKTTFSCRQKLSTEDKRSGCVVRATPFYKWAVTPSDFAGVRNEDIVASSHAYLSLTQYQPAMSSTKIKTGLVFFAYKGQEIETVIASILFRKSKSKLVGIERGEVVAVPARE